MGEGRAQHPKFPRNLQGGEVQECVCGPRCVWDLDPALLDSLLVQAGRARPAECRQCEQSGENVGISHSSCQTPDLGLLPSQRISVSQPSCFPGRAWQRCLPGSQLRATLVKTFLPLLGQSHPKFVFSADFPFVLPSRPCVCSTRPGMWVPYTMQCVQWCMLCSPSAFSGFQRKLQKKI